MQSIMLYLILLMQIQPEKEKTILCLGDSYTIGQSVKSEERFPEQTIDILQQKKIRFASPEIIAKTGWTSADLLNAIHQKLLNNDFDCVTLLIGVNDQYRGIDTSVYRKNFETLLQTAIACADKQNDHVFVLSIPDYGVTPFALSGRQTPEEISTEIDLFNSINKTIALKYQVHYIDINPESKKAKDDPSLLAYDKLHPSAKMYRVWAGMLAEEMQISRK